MHYAPLSLHKSQSLRRHHARLGPNCATTTSLCIRCLHMNQRQADVWTNTKSASKPSPAFPGLAETGTHPPLLMHMLLALAPNAARHGTYTQSPPSKPSSTFSGLARDWAASHHCQCTCCLHAQGLITDGAAIRDAYAACTCTNAELHQSLVHSVP